MLEYESCDSLQLIGWLGLSKDGPYHACWRASMSVIRSMLICSEVGDEGNVTGVCPLHSPMSYHDNKERIGYQQPCGAVRFMHRQRHLFRFPCNIIYSWKIVDARERSRVGLHDWGKTTTRRSPVPSSGHSKVEGGRGGQHRPIMLFSSKYNSEWGIFEWSPYTA